ncbi:MAG: recombinase family protein, partial [Defluviitaleaceae bacterium]|nr:recombinase family protein [Defluviitaleaceae bacterium]
DGKSILRTAIYVRVSTEEQVQEGFSIRGQTEKLKQYALLKDWEICNVYTDEGISGKNIVDRPAINRLIEDIKSGKVNNVLVFKVDRLTRNTKNLIELVELFEEYNCAFNSLTESIDTDTPSGRMFLKIIGIFAEFERENLVSRLKMGFERKVKEGYTLATNTVSYGYIKGKGQRVQEVQPEEARIVKEIFLMFVDEDMPMTKIARTLNERKIKAKMGGLWNTSTIRSVLSNSTYIGKVRYATNDKEKYFEADGHHERIISDEVFFRVQKKLKLIASITQTKRPKENNYFCGVLICSVCGGKYTTHHKPYTDEDGEKYYRTSYRCNNKRYYDAVIACKSHNIIHDKLERAFVEYIERINDFTEAESIELTEENQDNKRREQLEYIAICESKLSNLRDRKKRIMQRHVNGEIEFEEYRELLDVLNERFEALESELSKLSLESAKEEEVDSTSHMDIILSLKESWSYFSNKEKLMFLQRFVGRMVIVVEKERRNWNIVSIKEVTFN